ncbi:MAG TPA: hypothetical protein VEZ47_09515 [Gemmatirosa sp.]|nr:hypothetical protein [Gemmatirosa sp.]
MSDTPAHWPAERAASSIRSSVNRASDPPSTDDADRAYAVLNATRMRVPVSGTEIVVQARYPEALAPKNLSAAIIAAPYLVEFKGTNDERVFDLGNRWTAVAVFPDRHRFGSDSYVLAYVWVRSPDGLLYDLTVASWPDSTTYPALAQSARQIASSLKPIPISARFREAPLASDVGSPAGTARPNW